MRQQKNIVVNSRGYALLIVFIIMSAVTIGLVMLTSHIFKGERSSKNVVTVDRMHAVAKALGQYYLAHRDLPLPENGRVPVAPLSLSTSYRFDGWGQFIHYNYVSGLRGLVVDGKPVAAVLVSGGPGQEIETVTWPGSGTTYTDAANDDIVLPVTLQAEAIELATTTLHSLARKVCSYIWNNDNGSGTWYIDDHMTPLDDFLHEFDLDVDFYKIDPWGNNYQWLGSSSSPSNSFRSSGPDGTSSTADDIVVAARISGCGGTGHEEPNPIDGGSLLGYINFEEDQIDGNNIHIKAPHGNNVLGHQGARLVDHYETGDDYDGPPTASAGAYAAYFDGVGDFIEFNSTNAFSLTCQGDGEDCTNGDLTLTAWCKNDGAQSSQAFVISARDMENKSSYEGSCYFLGTEGKLVGGAWADYPFGGLWEGDGSSISNRSTENAVNPQIPENEWYFMAMVFDNGVSDNDAVLRLYYYYNDDGSFYNENKFLKIERTNLPSLHEDAFADKMTLYIGSGTCPEGKNKYKACNFFHGWIDEVAIFSEALTEEQIKIVMKGQ